MFQANVGGKPELGIGESNLWQWGGASGDHIVWGNRTDSHFTCRSAYNGSRPEKTDAVWCEKRRKTSDEEEERGKQVFSTCEGQEEGSLQQTRHQVQGPKVRG